MAKDILLLEQKIAAKENFRLCLDCLFLSENIIVFRGHISLSPFSLTYIKSL